MAIKKIENGPRLKQRLPRNMLGLFRPTKSF
jgi:hypothetical protein